MLRTGPEREQAVGGERGERGETAASGSTQQRRAVGAYTQQLSSWFGSDERHAVGPESCGQHVVDLVAYQCRPGIRVPALSSVSTKFKAGREPAEVSLWPKIGAGRLRVPEIGADTPPTVRSTSATTDCGILRTDAAWS